MGDEPGGDDSSATRRVSITLPGATLETLLEESPPGVDEQDAIKRAIWSQIERDRADSYTVVKNRE